MELKSIFTDDEAVSPVIGVILMVAITVILAAVIGTFVLGLGDQVQSTSPQASFNFDFTDEHSGPSNTYDQVQIVHDGGDSIAQERLSVVASENVGGGAENSTTGDYASTLPFTDGGFTLSGDVAAGSTITVSKLDSSGELNDATVRVVWTSQSGDNSATLGEWEGPAA